MAHQASLIFNDTLKVNGSKMGVGIHEECSVTSITVEDRYFDINFSNKAGEVHNKRLWAPNGNYPRTDKVTNVTETKQQAIEREEASNLSHIVKLLHIFLGEEGVAKFPALEYDDFVEKAASVLNPKFASKKVNLKLIYDGDGSYSTFGNFPDYIEEWTGSPATLKYSKWELENRLQKKEVVAPVRATNLADALRSA